MSLELFHKHAREEILARLGEEGYDLVVIGGGITGASVFRDAVMRGMRVALVEAKDFSWGTSSRSSKLIHGGLRYLRGLGLRLARESCRERNLQLRLNRRMVRPLAFAVPAYRGQGEPDWMMRAGLMTYEVLSGFRNHRVHRRLTRTEILSMAPGLPVEGLRGGWRYYDAAVADNRWTIETVKAGVREGGVALNYAPVVGFEKHAGKLRALSVVDTLSGREVEVRARVVVNATGVFADAVRKMDDVGARSLVRLSKGTHLVFRAEDVPVAVTTVFSSPLDGRPLFLIKQDGCFLYGTTDDWEETAPDDPAPAAGDVAYLLDSLANFMPQAGLGPEKVQFVYSGFRPLLGGGGKSAQASREDLIEVSQSGLISVVGGKLTTARLMADRVLTRVTRAIGGKWAACRTAAEPLGGSNLAVSEGLAEWAKRCPQLTGYFRVLFDRYGLDAGPICRSALAAFTGERLADGELPLAVIQPEVEYVCRYEMACMVEDLLDRRAGFLYWSPAKRLERIRFGATVLRKELGLDSAGFAAEVRDYREHLRRFHTLPGSV